MFFVIAFCALLSNALILSLNNKPNGFGKYNGILSESSSKKVPQSAKISTHGKSTKLAVTNKNKIVQAIKINQDHFAISKAAFHDIYLTAEDSLNMALLICTQNNAASLQDTESFIQSIYAFRDYIRKIASGEIVPIRVIENLQRVTDNLFGWLIEMEIIKLKRAELDMQDIRARRSDLFAFLPRIDENLEIVTIEKELKTKKIVSEIREYVDFAKTECLTTTLDSFNSEADYIFYNLLEISKQLDSISSNAATNMDFDRFEKLLSQLTLVYDQIVAIRELELNQRITSHNQISNAYELLSFKLDYIEMDTIQ